MVPANTAGRLALGAALAVAAAMPAIPAAAQIASLSTSNVDHAGQLDVPLNKSQVLTVDRPFAKALVGNQEVADILPMTNRSIYVLGKKVGTTSLTLYDSRNMLIAVVDVAVGPDVVTLKRQLSELIPGEPIGARISNDAVVLTGTVSSAAAVDRAVQVARTYAGGEDKVVNMLSIGASQQVMLEVRFSEVNRQAAKQIGLNHSFVGNKTAGSIGNLAGDSIVPTNNGGTPTILLDGLTDAFGVGTWSFKLGSLNIFSALDALERKGLVKTLAEPTLVALSGEKASFLAGGELSAPMVAAVLTIIGYSINDKIVILDRIREDLKLGVRGSFREIINLALNQTLSRTMITGGSVILATLALYLFGGGIINDFAFTFLVGVLVGTYSSIYIAAPLVLNWYKGEKPGLAKTTIVDEPVAARA